MSVGPERPEQPAPAAMRLPGREPAPSGLAAVRALDTHERSRRQTEQPGSTTSLYEGDLSGRNIWAVSQYPEHSLYIHRDELSTELLEAFADQHRELLADPRTAIGTWENRQGQVWVDIVVLVTSRGEAVRLGRRYNQEGVYHLGGEGFIETGGSGEIPHNVPPLDRRLEGIKSWL